MEPADFFRRLRFTYTSRDGTVACYSLPFELGGAEPISGLLLVDDDAGQRIFFDQARWTCRGDQRAYVANHPSIPGIGFLMADQKRGSSSDAYPYYRRIIVDHAGRELPENVRFQEGTWIRSDG